MTMNERLVGLLKMDWQTPLSALQRAGSLSLSQRVGEMIRAGYHVEKKWVRLGNGKTVRAYRIVD